MEQMKRCTNCGRFPFCEVQNICIHNANDFEKTYLDYWIKREMKLDECDGVNFKFKEVREWETKK